MTKADRNAYMRAWNARNREKVIATRAKHREANSCVGMMTLAERVDVTAAALVEVDADIVRLFVEASTCSDQLSAALHWAQIDALLDRRLIISARRTHAAEGASPADGSET